MQVRMRSPLPGIAAVGLVGGTGSATAYTVYVSNEKGNSITVLDSETLEVEETIPVGMRPRGIILTNDDKYLLICAGDEDTVQVLDVKSWQLVGDLPSGPQLLDLHPSGSPVYIANEDDSLLTVIDVNDKKVLAEVAVGVEPEGVGAQSRRQDRGGDLRNHQHGTFHRHRQFRDHRQRPGRVAAALRRVHGRREPVMGDIRGGRRGFGDRRQDAQDH